jgi:hypothetical protein
VRRHSLLFIAISLVALLALVAAGCGGEGDDEAQAPPTPTETSSMPAESGSVVRFADKQPPVSGYHKGQTVEYLDFGPINLAAGNEVAPIWVVTNGTPDQKNIIDVVPGDEGYSPLWQVNEVTFTEGTEPRTLKSADEVMEALAVGEVTIVETDTVVNCPVLGFDQHEILGFFEGKTVAYYDFGPIALADGNAVAPIWAVENGVEGQHNIIDTVPGEDDYTPLWGVVMVKFVDGVEPYLLDSASAVEKAKNAGDVMLTESDIVVNCPVL